MSWWWNGRGVLAGWVVVMLSPRSDVSAACRRPSKDSCALLLIRTRDAEIDLFTRPDVVGLSRRTAFDVGAEDDRLGQLVACQGDRRVRDDGIRFYGAVLGERDDGHHLLTPAVAWPPRHDDVGDQW